MNSLTNGSKRKVRIMDNSFKHRVRRKGIQISPAQPKKGLNGTGGQTRKIDVQEVLISTRAKTKAEMESMIP